MSVLDCRECGARGAIQEVGNAAVTCDLIITDDGTVENGGTSETWFESYSIDYYECRQCGRMASHDHAVEIGAARA